MFDPEKTFVGMGGYVFVSHSHLDIASVRCIRNALEKQGLEPILFYLRSMDNGNPSRAELLKQLICDEIDAREFFLYVSSKNAERSQWVQDELTHVRQNAPQKIAVLDLERDGDHVEEWLVNFVRRLRVFLSYSRYDKPLAMRVSDALLARDFRVYDTQRMLSAGDPWDTSVRHSIAEISDAGCVLVLITESSIRSAAVKHELDLAIQMNKRVIPTLVGSLRLPPDWEALLRSVSYCTLSDDPTDGELNRLIDAIRQ